MNAPRDCWFVPLIRYRRRPTPIPSTCSTRPTRRPMSDQFAMVPRAFSDRFFNAVTSFYACDGQSWPPSVSWWQPGCRIGFEESVLFRHLHASDVPYRYYGMFQYKITRGALGGACHLAQVAFDETCNLLGIAGAFASSFNRYTYVHVQRSTSCLPSSDSGFLSSGCVCMVCVRVPSDLGRSDSRLYITTQTIVNDCLSKTFS